MQTNQRDQKQEAEVPQPKVKVANPFAKTNSTDLTKKTTNGMKSSGSDIFSGLHKPNAVKKDVISQKAG